MAYIVLKSNEGVRWGILAEDINEDGTPRNLGGMNLEEFVQYQGRHNGGPDTTWEVESVMPNADFPDNEREREQ